MAMWRTDSYDLHLIGPPIGGAVLQRVYQLGDWFLPDDVNPWTTHPGGLADPFRTVFTIPNEQAAGAFTRARHALTVTHNGTLTFYSDQPPGNDPIVRNFIVYAIDEDGDRILLRIHRHDQLTGFEVTPPSLTVRPQAITRTMGFSVLATFRDRDRGQDFVSVGDISRQPDSLWRQAGGSGIINFGIAGVITIVPGQEIQPNPVPVEVVLGPSLFPAEQPLPQEPQRTKSATVKTLPAWDDPQSADPTEVTLIRGPGYAEIANVPNVLILPDGIVENDRAEFEKLMVDVVDRLSYYATTVPYKQLIKANAINFWMGWIASPESGGTTLDLYRPSLPDEEGHTPSTLFEVFEAREPDGASITNVLELTYRVGYPTMLAPTLTFTQQLQIWANQFGAAGAAYLNGAVEGLWDLWRRAVPGILIKERDTTFGIRVGDRPRVSEHSRSGTIGWHPRRLQRDELDAYLGGLQTRVNGVVQPMGNIWITPAQGAPAGIGKDSTLVTVFANSPRERGTETLRIRGSLVAVTVTEQPAVTLAPRPTTPSIVPLDPLPLPAAINVRQVGTLVHELSHTFFLDDEYSSHGLDAPAGSVAHIREDKPSWNLLTRADVEAAGTPGNILRTRIRWSNWPRIVAAGIVNGAPTSDGGSPPTFTIPLRPGHAKVFADARAAGKIPVDAILRFRIRPLVQRTSPTNFDDLDVLGPQMVFGDIDVPNNRVTVLGNTAVGTWVNQHTVEFNGRIILLAVRRQNGVEQTVLHPAVGQAIETNHAPLNRAPNDLTCVAPPNFKTFRAPGVDTIPAAVKRPPNLRRMIGLYDGGDGYSCELFHAAFDCTMNDADGKDDVPPGLVIVMGKDPISIVTPLCHVCRYILVDQLAPTLHGVIDDLYSRDYPG